ncbi:hypothetical protein EB796_004439 [Bugula neritina]|uniref:Uncharacterized protein n=1 Tax=Bugula neritina TaxID=10212 RepID=A0A7J7KF34_BUGNE|nr:hypothetical protein EB796_004439 [Bugula neritina]
MKVIAILLAVCLALTSATYNNNYLYGGYGLSNYKYYNRGLYNRGLYNNYRGYNFGKGYNLYPSKLSSYYGRY